MKVPKSALRQSSSFTRSSLLSGVTAVKVAEADIVVVTVHLRRMSTDDDVHILSGEGCLLSI